MGGRWRVARLGVCFVFAAFAVQAQVPLMINHQGFIKISGEPFTGTGKFKFEIYDASDANNWKWTNNGSVLGTDNSNVPTAHENVVVTNGHYAVALGKTVADAYQSAMVAIPSTVFSSSSNLYLRIYFHESNEALAVALSPDVRLTAAPYATYAADADTVDGAHASALEESAEIDADLVTHNAGTSAHSALSLSSNTTLSASNIQTGTLADARLSSNVSKLGSSIDLASEVTGTLPAGRLPLPLFTPGSLYGGVISNSVVDSLNDLEMTEIWCSDDTNTGTIHVAGMIKRIDALWAAGTNGGGLDSDYDLSTPVDPADGRMMYIFAIGDAEVPSDGDWLISDDPDSPVMPSGYEWKRLIGGRIWDGVGGRWVEFTTSGNGPDKWVSFVAPMGTEQRNSTVVNQWITTDTFGSSSPVAVQLVPLATSRLARILLHYVSGVGASPTHPSVDAQLWIGVAETALGGDFDTHRFESAQVSCDGTQMLLGQNCDVRLDGSGNFQSRVQCDNSHTYQLEISVRGYLEEL